VFFKEIRLMDDETLTGHFKNLDLRVGGVQQILQQNVGPRLTSMESRLSNVEARLSTVDGRLSTVDGRLSNVEATLSKVDGRLSNVEQILPTFATKEDLNEGLDRSRRHMDVIAESLRDDIQLIAENLAALMSKRTGS
jgi:uncharacterized protein YicC (UPF0701 family)